MRLRINMDVAALMNFVALKRTKPVNPKTCCAAGGKTAPTTIDQLLFNNLFG